MSSRFVIKRPHFVSLQLGSLWFVLDKTFGFYFDRNGVCTNNAVVGYTRNEARMIAKSYNQAVKLAFEGGDSDE
jgi:hypothetical protein